jgi:hypothetical protein
MACPEPVMEVEARFLAALAGVRRLGFLGDRLALGTGKDGVPATLLFARRGEDEAEETAAAIDPEAMTIATRMAQRLARAERFSFRADVGYDAVQRDGQTVEFGGERRVTVRRPDRLHTEVTDRSGGRRVVVYDGRALSYWNEAQNAWASTPRTGSLDETIDYLVDDLGVSLPLAELLSTDLPQTLEREVAEASYVGVETLGGVECDHLALRNEVLGVQFWVARSGEPLPRRIVIVYEQAEGRPQFRADLSGWDLAPRTPESLFAFDPPDGAERVPFLPRRRPMAEEAR